MFSFLEQNNFWKNNKYIILISIIGFLLTGVMAYPYYMHFDSRYAFTKYSLEGLNPTNWMGWFYVYVWDFIYSITKNQRSMGTLHNILYWIAMPIIYLNLFVKKDTNMKFKSSYNIWYMIFAFSPFAITLLVGITNNILFATLLLCSIACYTGYLKNNNKLFVVLSLIILVLSSFIRRDSLILTIPLMVYFSFIISQRHLVKGLLLFSLFFGTYFFINKSIVTNIPNYNNYQEEQYVIKTVELVVLYDLLVMSWYKKELLLPDYVLKKEFRGENRSEFLKILRSFDIYELAFGWKIIQDEIGPLLESGTAWMSGIDVKDVIPIYLNNKWWYFWLKLNMFYVYGIILFPTLILSIITLLILVNKQFSMIFSYEIKEWIFINIMSAWMFSASVILSVNSFQPRYLISANIIFWMMAVYVLYQVNNYYKITINYERK